MITTTPFDVRAYLGDEATIAAYVEAWRELGKPDEIAHAEAVAAECRGKLAK